MLFPVILLMVFVFVFVAVFVAVADAIVVVRVIFGDTVEDGVVGRQRGMCRNGGERRLRRLPGKPDESLSGEKKAWCEFALSTVSPDLINRVS